MSQYTNLYDFIRVECEKKGVSISKMCKEINISTCLPTNWKNGSIPGERALKKMAEYFGISYDELIRMRNIDKKVAREKIEASGHTPVKTPLFIKVPVYGTIAAGNPITAYENNLGYVYYPFKMVKNGEEYFALQVKGDSMSPDIKQGDIVILKKQSTVNSGQIAAVLIENEEATLKKIERTPSGITLIPLNPSYKSVFFSNKQIELLPVTILGCAVETRRTIY